MLAQKKRICLGKPETLADNIIRKKFADNIIRNTCRQYHST